MWLFGKPMASSEEAQLCNGETSRFEGENPREVKIVTNVQLGSGNGKQVRIRSVDLRHPLESPYNFYTWADLIADFTKDVVLQHDALHTGAALVCNSIGTISSFQAVIDHPSLFKGVFVVCPNFRELHSAEIPLSRFSMPIIRYIQKLLRTKGQSLFEKLATPPTVKQILLAPYKVPEVVDDVLIQVLLDPLLTLGASQVVFDTLSYSAGPLPEQQLAKFPPSKPVWVGYGGADPWTPGPRVESLARFDAVEKVQKWPNVGHCPHDEAPEQVHPMLLDFLQRLGIPQTSQPNPAEDSQSVTN